MRFIQQLIELQRFQESVMLIESAEDVLGNIIVIIDHDKPLSSAGIVSGLSNREEQDTALLARVLAACEAIVRAAERQDEQKQQAILNLLDNAQLATNDKTTVKLAQLGERYLNGKLFDAWKSRLDQLKAALENSKEDPKTYQALKLDLSRDIKKLNIQLTRVHGALKQNASDQEMVPSLA